MGRKPAAEEGGGLAQVTFHEADGDVEQLGDLGHGATAEVAQLDDAGLAGVQGGELFIHPPPTRSYPGTKLAVRTGGGGEAEAVQGVGDLVRA